jgi:tetratricopeptide (TPR) repeat protein
MEYIGHRSSRFGNNKHQPEPIDAVGEKLKTLEPPDSFHLSAAEGWLELGDLLEANEELERITPPMSIHPLMLEMRWKVYSKRGKWELAAEIARALTEVLPDSSWGYIHYAYSLHELKRSKEAWGVLIPVVDKFTDFIIRYNLACYACQLGNLDESMQWLEKAVELSGRKEIRLMALEDPDLKPLWRVLRNSA